MYEDFDIYKHDRELIKRDGTLYKKIKTYYLQEMDAYEDEEEKHCMGVMAAINAIYRLGESNGFKNGFEAGRNAEKKASMQK